MQQKIIPKLCIAVGGERGRPEGGQRAAGSRQQAGVAQPSLTMGSRGIAARCGARGRWHQGGSKSVAPERGRAVRATHPGSGAARLRTGELGPAPRAARRLNGEGAGRRGHRDLFCLSGGIHAAPRRIVGIPGALIRFRRYQDFHRGEDRRASGEMAARADNPDLLPPASPATPRERGPRVQAGWERG